MSKTLTIEGLDGEDSITLTPGTGDKKENPDSSNIVTVSPEEFLALQALQRQMKEGQKDANEVDGYIKTKILQILYRLRRYFGGVVTLGAFATVISAATMPACTSPKSYENQPKVTASAAPGGGPDPDDEYGVKKSPLTIDDVPNLSTPDVPVWDIPGNEYADITTGEIDEKRVVIFTMGNGGIDTWDTYYVESNLDNPEECFTQGTPQVVAGLEGMIGNISSLAIYGDKIYFDDAGDVKEGTLSFNAGVLTVSNITDMGLGTGADELSVVMENGDPYLYVAAGSSVAKVNLTTGEPAASSLDGTCGLPDVEGLCVTPYVDGAGCSVGVKPTIDSPNGDILPLTVLNTGSTNSKHPRVAKSSTTSAELIIYLQEVGGEFKLKYSCVNDCVVDNPEPQPEAEDTAEPAPDTADEVDAGSTDTGEDVPPADETTGEDIPPADEVTGEDIPPADEVTGEDVPPADEVTGEDVPPADETTGEDIPPEDETTGEDIPPADETTGEDIPPADETTGEDVPPADEYTPEVYPPEEICDDEIDNDLDGATDCDDDDCVGDINCDEACTSNPDQILNPGEAPPVTSCELEDGRFELNIEGNGTEKLIIANPFDMDAEPVELTISKSDQYTGGATYHVVCLQNPDNKMECGAVDSGLNIEIVEQENGYKATVVGYGVSMASAASHFTFNNIGVRNIFMDGVERSLTVVEVASYNEPHEELAYVFHQEEGWYFDIPSDGQRYLINADTGERTLTNEGVSCSDGIDNDNNNLTDCEDPGCILAEECQEPVEPQPDSNPEAAADTSGPDNPESTQAEEENGGGGNGGCNQGCDSSNEKPNSTAVPAAVVLSVLAFLAMRNKGKEKVTTGMVLGSFIREKVLRMFRR